MEVLTCCEEELSWWDVRCIAADEYVKRCDDMVRDYRMNVLSSLEHSKRLDELTKEVLDALGQPLQGRPEDESALSTFEWDIKKHNPGEYMERWGKLWKDWEDDRITSTEEYWRIWGGEMWSMFFIQPQKEVTISRPVPSPVDTHQPVEDHVSQLTRIQEALAESQSSVHCHIAQVVDTLKSEMPLSRQKTSNKFFGFLTSQSFMTWL